MALVCETVTATTTSELVRLRDLSRADVVELRLDFVDRPDVAAALANRRLPVVVTCRPRAEGGRFDGPETDRLALLAQAIQLGAEYVDVEHNVDAATLPVGRMTRLIHSLHDFRGIPADLADRVRELRRKARGGIVKVAVQVASPEQCIDLRVAAGTGEQNVIALGTAGTISRICPWLFASAWTYGGQVAPGQVPVDQLIDLYRVREHTSSTRVFAVTGAPLGHSASPAMFNAAFDAAGIDAVYLPIETGSAAAFKATAEAFGVEGASVTAPQKRAWLDLAAGVPPRVKTIGALNTVKRTPQGWDAQNFDLDGFLAPLRARAIPLQGRHVVVLGAGGAALAVTQALKQEGASVAVSARRTDQAEQIAEAVEVRATSWPPPGGWDLLVNATPVGTSPHVDASPMPSSALRGGLVYDLVYNPLETRLLRDAKCAGIPGIGGLEMLVAQAERQFAYWMGRQPPAGVMENAARQFVTRGGSTA